jgi:hypothetical protein
MGSTEPRSAAAIAPPPSGGVIPTRGPAPQAPVITSLPIVLPPPNAGFDYQLGGAYPLPSGVGVVGRDRTAAPASSSYNICYVNGFQTQPDESAWWLANHPTLVLRNGNGNPLIDPEWPDEYILDTSSTQKRTAIAAIVGPWITACATSGFQGVEIDNLDTYTRFPSQLTADGAVALASLYRNVAHGAGLAIAQKNSAELLSRKAEMSLDFAVVEQCGQYNECDDFTNAYGAQVYVIEYQRAAFDGVCAAFEQLSVVLRDVNLVTPSTPGYVRDAC